MELIVTKRENALKLFCALTQKYKDLKNKLHSANEAKTRLLIIDEILQILGWDKESFNPESYSKNVGYSDYLLKLDNNPRLIVEAKRVGDTFCHPSLNLTKEEYTVSYFKRAFKNNLTEVINQAKKYCYEESVSFALITNGREWLVLQLIPKPNKTADSMKGIYFGDIFKENFSFDMFWSLLSKEAFESNNLDEHLSSINYTASQVCHIVSSEFHSLNWNESFNQHYISEFYENFFSKITESNQRKMLELCFVSDSKLEQYKGDLKRVLKDIKPRFLPNDTEDLEPGEGKELLASDKNNGKVLIITGSIGCGKTTLVTKSLLEVKRNETMRALPIMVDLINEVKGANKSVKEIIYDEVYKTLRESYPTEINLQNLKRTFNFELRELKNGEYSELFKTNPSLYQEKEAELLNSLKLDRENFILKTLRRITNQNASVVLILDNIDRAEEEFQEEAYTLAHKISSKTGATVIVTLREFTFFKNKDKGFLDVRPEDKVIHLKAPDFRKLVSKRVKYINTNFHNDYRLREWRKMYDLDEFEKAMKNHATTVKMSVLESTKGYSILEILSSISWHNIRLFFESLKRVHKQLGATSTCWNNSDVVSALMSHPVDGELPKIPNIFKPYHNVNQCYFLKIRILIFLTNSLKPGEVTHGVSGLRIYNFIKLYGYRLEWARKTLEECVQERLVECLDLPSDSDLTSNYEVNDSSHFRISPLGVYCINELVLIPIYLSLISIDLPFHERTVYSSVVKELEELINISSEISYLEASGLILDSKVYNHVSAYLYEQYQKEMIISKSLESNTQVHATEIKLKGIMSNIFNKGIDSPKSEYIASIEAGNSLQGNLFDDSSQMLDTAEINSFLPKNLCSYKYLGSEYIPLIYIALIILKMKNIENSRGAEITDIINTYILADNEHKFTNNVSRALRGNKLLKQEWLLVRKNLHKKFKFFSLSDNWKDYWEPIFNTKLPVQLHEL